MKKANLLIGLSLLIVSQQTYMQTSIKTKNSDAHTPQTIVHYFSKMTDNFVSILHTPQSIENISNNIANMFSNLVHITIDLFKNSPQEQLKQQEAIKNYLENMDPQERISLINLIKKNRSTLMHKSAQLYRNNSDLKGTQEAISKPTNAQETQVILHHFGKIVNNFFNIVQDPEEAANVGNNLAEMLANIVHIATTVMKKGFPRDNNKEDITKFINSMDDNTKIEIIKLIYARAAIY